MLCTEDLTGLNRCGIIDPKRLPSIIRRQTPLTPTQMKTIRFSTHALVQIAERGASQDQVIETIGTGEKTPAKRGRQAFRKNFQYDREWGNRNFAIQQILVIVAEEVDALIVVTVYTFYF